MKIRIIILLLGWLCLCPAGPAFCVDANQPEGIVAYCFDGDTVKLKDRRVVRLAGIDSPEVAHKDAPAQYYSRQSRQMLESLTRGKPVRIVFPGVSNKDRHGRLIAELILPDGQSVNELMVDRGAAFFYPHQDLESEFQEKLKKAQADAIEERRGMWEHMLNLPLAKGHYVGNRASMRFFPAYCQASGRIKPRNRENFGTLMDAFLAGYAPARICIFWPEQ